MSNKMAEHVNGVFYHQNQAFDANSLGSVLSENLETLSKDDSAVISNTHLTIEKSQPPIQTTISKMTKLITIWHGLRGLFFSFLSSVFFALTSVIVKKLHHVMHPGLLACIRFLGILVMTIPLLSYTDGHIFGRSGLRMHLLARGLTGGTSLFLRYVAFTYLPIANATIIILSMPVFVCLFARFFLKEDFGIFHVIALTVTLMGIALTARVDRVIGSLFTAQAENSSSFSNQHVWGVSAAISTTLIGASTYIFVRKLRELDASIIIFNFAWISIVELSIVTYSMDGMRLPQVCEENLWLLPVLCVLSFYAQFLITKSLQYEQAGIVSVTRASFEMVFAFIFQIMFFKMIPDIFSFAGAFLVLISVFLTGMRKYVVGLPKESQMRIWFGFTLK